MDINGLHLLPEWNERLLRIQDGEAWKHAAALDIAKRLYNQWREVFLLVTAFAEMLPEEDDGQITAQKLIYENLMMVAPKIMSAAGDTLYIIKMENAAIIRTNCRQLMEQVIYAAMTNETETHYEGAIREAMDNFQQLFRQWVATFQKDDIEDEWGLF